MFSHTKMISEILTSSNYGYGLTRTTGTSQLQHGVLDWHMALGMNISARSSPFLLSTSAKIPSIE